MRDPQNFRERRKEALREQIAATARGLFIEVGYDAFSMRKLAERVGCSVGNLYRYFPSREGLFRSLIDESFAELNDTLAGNVVAGTNDVVARLKRGMRAYVDFGLRHPDAYRVAFLVRRPTQHGAIKPHAAFDVLRGIVGECVAARRFRAVDVDLASQTVWAAIHGLTSLLIQLPQFPWVERDELVATVIDNSVAGFLRPKKGQS